MRAKNSFVFEFEDRALKPYYDHDFLWAQRRADGNAVWGGSSHWVYRQILSKLDDYVDIDKSMLDVGCGAGAFGMLATAKGYRYVGIDASAVGIDLGHKHYPQLALKVVDAAMPDLSALGGALYPVLTCVNVLHCLTGASERHQLLTNLSRLATDDAVLVLTTMIGPVAADVQEKRLPRAYKTTAEILAELVASGWGKTELCDEMPPNAYSKIGNLMLICRKGL